MASTRDDMIAGLQGAVAELRRERDIARAERDATLTHHGEYDERIAHQSAIIDVLKLMSDSPGDPLPVLEMIVERASAFCEADGAAVALLEGGELQLQTHRGYAASTPRAFESWFPLAVDTTTIMGRTILAREVVIVSDIRADLGHVANTRPAVDMRSLVGLPMLRGGQPIGVITLGRHAPGDFTPAQVELLRTFAEQAVIAVGSATTFRALQARTGELQESLDFQTATSDVLKLISRSTFDLQPVLDAVAETAVRLCDADMASIFRREGDLYRLATEFGYPPEYTEWRTALGPLPPDGTNVGSRTARERRTVHIHDVATEPGYPTGSIAPGKQRTSLGVPLLRDGDAIGYIVLARRRVEPFTERQIELVNTFADQAVIAMENTRLLAEQREALEQQTATADVLRVINASRGDLTPVFDTLLEKAMRLCGAAFGLLYTHDGDDTRVVATHGVPAALADFRQKNPVIGLGGEGGPTTRVLSTRRPVHILDWREEEVYKRGTPYGRANADLGGARTLLMMPLLKDEAVLGYISIYRQEVRAFSDKEIALLESFASQAVIAMENARLLTEQREALEQQTATSEVLQVINASPGNLIPVFDAMLDNAMRLCGAAFGLLATREVGGGLQTVAARGVPPEYAAFRSTFRSPERIPGGPATQAIETKQPVHILDMMTHESYRAGVVPARAAVDLGGARTILHVPLLKDDVVKGIFTIYRQEVRAFSEKEIALLQNFAAQAVIAMENARLLGELRARTDELAQRQAELRVTFENMGDGVAMFDETQHLAAWNRKFQEILDVPDEIIAQRKTFAEYIRYLAGRGEFGPNSNVEEQVLRLLQGIGQRRTFERTRPDGRVIEVRNNPVAGGGFVVIYADITERKRNEAAIAAARDAAETALRELKIAQANLVQAEKMASLGQLTAGIAHEIRNPLNFINNFAVPCVDMLKELKEALEKISGLLDDDQREEIDDIIGILTGNLEKVTHHGNRADGIVMAMLEHSRGSSGERRVVDINELADEALNLAYHGARAQDQNFNIALERDFGDGIAPIELNPRDMTRVLLNLFSNGFYAANMRGRSGVDNDFAPTLRVTTRDIGDAVEIRVRDNGTGIPADIRDKLFQPFFTTKPSGQGTGLGLSITYDIVTKAHGGTIAIDSEVGAFTEFVITLPRGMFANEGSRA